MNPFNHVNYPGRKNRLILIHLVFILGLAVIPVIIGLTYINFLRVNIISDEQKNSLSGIMALAQKNIEAPLALYQKNLLSQENTLAEIKKILNTLDSSQTGYFFIFSGDGALEYPGDISQKNITFLADAAFFKQLLNTSTLQNQGAFINYVIPVNDSKTGKEIIAFFIKLPSLNYFLGIVNPNLSLEHYLLPLMVRILLPVALIILLITIPVIFSIRTIFNNQLTLENEVEARRKSTRQAEALARCASHLNDRLDLTTVSEAICEEAAQTLSVPVAMVHLFNESMDDFQLVATYGIPDDIKKCSESILRDSLKPDNERIHAERLIIIPDLNQLPISFQSICEQMDLRTMVSVKLLHESTIIGFLNVFSTGNIRDFKKDELALLEALSDYMSGSIFNARLFEQVKAGRERMKILSQKLVETQESEKRHLARELHDEIGQKLTHIKMSLDQINPDDDTLNCKKSVAKAQGLTQELMDQIRTLSLDLRPTILDDLGLLPAMLWHFERYTAQTGIKVNFKYNSLDNRFPASIETTAYRVLQEALTNAARYSGQKEVSVFAWSDDQNLGLQIIDEGRGFNVDEALLIQKTGGLSGMQERAGLCNGHLLIESNPGEGTSITLNIPIDGSYLERRRYDRNDHSG
ncbi:MAG: histidine kinase, partial [Anaerolineae bacterium]|nr:histidine kinase [Anaerolineae bacterium]